MLWESNLRTLSDSDSAERDRLRLTPPGSSTLTSMQSEVLAILYWLIYSLCSTKEG